jgi:hypothetical protein
MDLRDNEELQERLDSQEYLAKMASLGLLVT